MSSPQESQHNTLMFARVLGPFLVISCVTAVVRASDMRALVTAFGANPVWPWVTGAFMLVGGLIVVALHQCWRGAAAVVVSVMGWLLALRGLFLLASQRRSCRWRTRYSRRAGCGERSVSASR
jgi:K+ transporter